MLSIILAHTVFSNKGKYHAIQAQGQYLFLQDANAHFYKESTGWYIDLPEFIAQGGSKGDLQMVEGADTMLDLMAGEDTIVTLVIDEEFFEGADRLELTEKCDPYIGGGYYLLRNWENRPVMKTMWLCAVTEYVFGYLPEQIFIKRANNILD